MGSKLQNLKREWNRLRHHGFRRAREILHDYGMAELFARVKAKLNKDPAQAFARTHIITNESYLRNLQKLAAFECAPDVSFTILPRSTNISRVEIATRKLRDGAILHMEIADAAGNVYLRTSTTDVANSGYTCFEDFLPVLEAVLPDSYQPREMTIRVWCEDGSCGVLVDRAHKKAGFTVAGGGRVVCRVYARPDAMYVHWMAHNTPTAEELAAQRAHVFAKPVKFSIVTPLYNTPERLFRDLLDSVVAQTYANWEFCLADGSTEQNRLQEIIAEYGDPRILYKKLETNEGISGNTNHGIEMATGDYIALLDHDDTIAPHALFTYAKMINADADTELLYCDEDKLTDDGTRRLDPFFKPDFAPDNLLAGNYITHFLCIKKTLLDEVGWLDSTYNGAQDFDLTLRATEKAKKVGHADDILYHWRLAPTSTAFSSGTKSYTIEAGRTAVQAALDRRGLHAHAENNLLPNYYNVVYDIPQPQPKVSIIIPNHNERETLKTCLDSITKKTTYANYEIVIVENNSTDADLAQYYDTLRTDPHIKIAEWHHPFNYAALNNYAATQATGDLLLFLNNDTSVITPDWLEQLAMHAGRPEVGCVGAKLLYPDNTNQHAGIVLRLGGVAGHAQMGVHADDVGAFAYMIVVHDVSAVTGACLMVRKEVFDRVGGFDERFTVALNDVDFCLRVRELGLYNIFTPFARLYHYESKTRGYEDTPEKLERFNRERALWLSVWAEKYPVDPFYNRNLTLVFSDRSVAPGRVDR